MTTQMDISELRRKFWVVAVTSNPVRYETRDDLYDQFIRRMEVAGANVIRVEQAFGDRPFLHTEPNNPFHVQVRSFDELWHKENMINLGINYLPQDWEYVAWVDTDVEFVRPDWIEETIHQLQHYYFVQMFEQAVDLGPRQQTLKVHNGFVYNYNRGVQETSSNPYYHQYGYVGHPGFAWAARREAIDMVGGLMDFPILGSADHHMAMALIDRVEHCRPSKANVVYKAMLKMWEDRAKKLVTRDIGYVPGTLLHHWHGKKKDRKYVERWQILIDNDYNPFTDLKRDWQGLWQLSGNKPKLRDDIRQYFRSRNEDSIDLE